MLLIHFGVLCCFFLFLFFNIFFPYAYADGAVCAFDETLITLNDYCTTNYIVQSAIVLDE